MQVARPNFQNPAQGVLRRRTNAWPCLFQIQRSPMVLPAVPWHPLRAPLAWGCAPRRPVASWQLPRDPRQRALRDSPTAQSRTPWPSTIALSEGRAAEGATVSDSFTGASAGIFVLRSRNTPVAYLPEAPPLFATTRLHVPRKPEYVTDDALAGGRPHQAGEAPLALHPPNDCPLRS